MWCSRSVGRSVGRSVYGHVITKFSGMGRFTKLWGFALAWSSAIIFKFLTITYKALNGLAPGHIKDLLKKYIPTRTLRSSTWNLLEVLWVNIVIYGQGLSPLQHLIGGTHFQSIFMEVPHYQSLKRTLRLTSSNILTGTSPWTVYRISNHISSRCYRFNF